MEITRDVFLNTPDPLKMVKVKTPEWPFPHVYVRVLSGTETKEVQRLTGTVEAGNVKPDDLDVWAAICVLVVCDEKGNPIFRPDDAAEILRRSAPAMMRCAWAGMRLNTLTEDSFEELVGNSEETTSDKLG